MLRARAALLAAAMIGCSAETAPELVEPPLPEKQPVALGPSTVPQSAFTGGSAACGDLFAFRASEDGTQIFGVTFTHARSEQVIDLGTNPDGVLVTVDVFAEAASGLACDALAGSGGAKTTWVAEAGRLEAIVGEEDIEFVLEDVHLVGPEKGFAVVVPRVVIGARR